MCFHIADPCRSSIVDMCIIVDSSGSICDSDPNPDLDPNGNPVNCGNWRFIQRFLGLILGPLQIGEDAAHIGLVRFSSNTDIILRLNRFVNRDSSMRKV